MPAYVETLPDSIDLVDHRCLLYLPKDPAAGRDAMVGPQEGRIIALVKPQFEAGRKTAGRGKGVILDEKVHQEVVTESWNFSASLGLSPTGLIYSPLTGPKGTGNSWFSCNLERAVYRISPH